MHIPSSAPQGTMIGKYDPINIILFISWKDSTVVLLISTTEILGIISVQECIEPQKIMVPCGKNAADYVSKIGGVDKIDWRNKVVGGFAMKSHFHKSIKDLMANQGEVGWNMSARM